MNNIKLVDDKIIVEEDNGLFGILDDFGEYEAIYEKITPIGDKSFIVKDKNGYKTIHYIDEINRVFSDYYEYMFKYGNNVVVRNGAKLGLLNPNDGKLLLDIKYDNIYGDYIGERRSRTPFYGDYAYYAYYYNGEVYFSTRGKPYFLEGDLLFIYNDLTDITRDIRGNTLYKRNSDTNTYNIVDLTKKELLRFNVTLLREFREFTSHNGKKVKRAVICYNKGYGVIHEVIDEHGKTLFSDTNVDQIDFGNRGIIAVRYEHEYSKSRWSEVINSDGIIIFRSADNLIFNDDFIIKNDLSQMATLFDYDGRICHIPGNYSSVYGYDKVYVFYDGDKDKYKLGRYDKTFFEMEIEDAFYDKAEVYEDNMALVANKEVDYHSNNPYEKFVYALLYSDFSTFLKVDNPDKIEYISDINALYYLKNGIASIRYLSGAGKDIPCDDIEYQNYYFILKKDNMYGVYDNLFNEVLPCIYSYLEIYGKYAKISMNNPERVSDKHTNFYLIDLEKPDKIYSHMDEFKGNIKKKVLKDGEIYG